MKKKPASLKKVIIFLTLLLTLLSIPAVFESSLGESLTKFSNPYTLFFYHFRWLAVGLLIFVASANIPTKFWKWYGLLMFIASLLGLIAVFIPALGININGARRWINIGLFQFQPVEILKLSVALFFSGWLAKHQRIIPLLFLTAIPVLLLLLQPDLGSTLIILAISFGLFLAAGGDLKFMIIINLIGLVVGSLLIISSPYRRQRVQTFLNPSVDPLGSSYHIRQITIALGNGGIWGRGIGGSQQKFQYIPEASTDSIFAIIAEETGLIGASIIILIYLALFQSYFKLAVQLTDSPREYLLVIGIAIWHISQTALNLAAVVALVPLTGLPLPFISRGGTSLIMILLSSGIIVKIAARVDKKIKKNRH